MNNIRNLKKINLDSFSLYLKYGYISIPRLKPIYKNYNSNKWIKTYYKIEKNINSELVLNYLKSKVDRFVKNQKKQNKKICLMLSSGADSRLLYNLIEQSVIKYEYTNNFFNFTGTFKGYKKYSENEILKKKWNKKIINHRLVNINPKSFFMLINQANKINEQPVNGLPNIIYVKIVEEVSKIFGSENVVIVAGIGDQIFFNGTIKILKATMKDKNYNKTHDHIFNKPSNYLQREYDIKADRIKEKLKPLKIFKIKSNYHYFINQNNFMYRGPKVISEFQNIFRHFKVKSFIPFIDKKFICLILSLPLNELHDKKNIKTFIYFANKVTDPHQKPFTGLKMTTPQREIIYSNKKKISKMINNSSLINYDIVNKSKFLKQFNKYNKNYSIIKKK